MDGEADPGDLAKLSVAELGELLLDQAERVPRELIEECARRGEAMITWLENLLETTAPDEDDGAWWLQIHAAMIYGRMPEERAGEALARLMRGVADRGDEGAQDWLAGYWPGLFATKSEAVLMAVRGIASDRKLGWYPRVNALHTLVAWAQRAGTQALEQELIRVGAIAADESEERELRLEAGNVLLDFPRPQYRTLLERLAQWQGALGVHFSANDVRKAYVQMKDEPPWRSFEEPWDKFYAPDEIEMRSMEPGDGEDPFSAEDPIYGHGPFVREAPKVGRNDPCPCGSGKKYKKCCLEKAAPG